MQLQNEIFPHPVVICQLHFDFPCHDEDRAQYLTQLAMHIVWNLKQAENTGFNIVQIALATICRPNVPPGKKLTRYQSNETSCTPEKNVRCVTDQE